MADVNANIGVNIDTSNALAQLKSLQRQLSQFHTSVAKSSTAAATAQASLQKNLINSINATGAFTAELRTVKTTSEAFTNSLEKNKFSMREYFRYAGAATKTFGKTFQSEFDTIGKVAEDRVKKLQTQYIKLGRDTQGAMKAIAVIPNQLDLSSHSTQLQLAAQRQAIFNQLLKQGSTNLLNFGKNTQWAGRQLMVGFTLPLASLGMVASKAFMDMETAALKFRKVYGDLLTPKAETQKALENVQELAKEFTKYGIAVSQTVSLAAEAAAAGFQGLDLQRQTIQATRLSILGQLDTQKALDTTIALQNAFKMSSEDLADSINFLNAVENQTVVSLDDITTAIPKVAPVIQQLGGDVKDLAFFMTAMKQGGINASEGANALKSGLAALINPTNTASKMLAGMGINIKSIVESNQGDLKSTVIDFALALDKLDPLNRARAIEQMFGKFQFARLSALFSNVIADGTQASRVLDLAGASIEDLASLSESELAMTAGSAMNKFRKAVEDLKVALVPVGEAFLQSVTPILEFFGNILEKFGSLSDNTKKIITVLTIAIGGIGPVALMAFGLLANGIANIIKLFATLRNGYLRLTGQSAVLGEQTQYLTTEQLEASAAAHSLNQSHANLTQTFTSEAGSVRALIAAYQDGTRAASQFAMANPGMMLPGRGRAPKKFAQGGMISGPGGPTSDSVPVMASNGEAIISAETVKKYPGIVAGLIAGNVPGFKKTGIVGEGAQSGKISIYPEFMLRLQDAIQNMGQRAGNTGVPNVLAPLATRVGEARGMAPTPSAIASGRFDAIYDEYEGLTTTFVDNLNREYDGTFKDIKDTNERMAKSWFAAGKSVEKQVDSISADADRGVVRKVFGLDPDEYGTIPTDSREAGGVVPNRGRRGAFQAKLAGFRSYTSIRPAAKKLFERKTGQSAAALQMGHVLGPNSIDISTLENDPRKTGAVASAAKILDRGKKDGAAYSQGLEKSTQDPYMASRDRKSPHPQAPKDGKDDAIAYQNAVNKSIERQKRKLAKQNKSISSIGPNTPAGATMLPIVSKPSQSDLRRTAIRDRARSVGGKVAGSMRGGRGMGISSGAMIASQFLPGKAGQLAGQASGALFAVQALQMLPGPLKLAAVAAGGLFAAHKLLATVSERARVKIEGLGDIANLTGDKLKSLDEFFGVTPTVSPFENPGTNQVTPPEKTQAIQTLSQNEKFQTNFKDDIKRLREASNREASAALNALSIKLSGRGYSKDNIDTILRTLQKEAGKASLDLEFKNLDINTKEGKQGFKKNINETVKLASEAMNKGMVKTVKQVAEFDPVNPRGSRIVNKIATVFTDQAKKNISTVSESITAMITGLSGQLANGKINAEQFSAAFVDISNAVKTMPKAQGLFMLDVLMKSIPEDLRASARGINDINSQLLILEAQALGMTNLPGLVQDLNIAVNGFGPDQVFAQKRVDETKKEMTERSKIIEEFGKRIGGTGGVIEATDGLSAATKNYLKILDQEISVLEKKRDANKAANNEMQRQIDLQLKQQDLTNQMKQAQISGDYLGAAFLGQQKRKNTLEFNQQTSENILEAAIKRIEERIAELKDGKPLKPQEVKKMKKANGGYINSFMGGGNVSGKGTGKSDSIPAMLSNGEYVIQADSVNKYGQALFDSLNAQKFANGGRVKGYAQGGMPNVTGMGLDWLGKTLFKSGNSVIKNLLGFDATTPMNKKSGMEKLSMASMLVPGSSAAKTGMKAAKLADPEVMKYFLKRGSDGDILGIDDIIAVRGSGNDKVIDAFTQLVHDPIEGSQLFNIGNAGSIKTTRDLLAISLMRGANVSGINKAGIGFGASPDRSIYAEQLVETLRKRGLGKVLNLPAREASSVGSTKAEADSWMFQTLNKLNNKEDIFEGSVEIPGPALDTARSALSGLLKGGYDKKIFAEYLKTFNQQSGMKKGFAMGGLINLPKFHDWNGPVPGTYGQELPAMIKSGTEGIYQEGYINDLKQAASNTTNSANSVYNVSMTIDGGNSSPKEIAQEVMKQMQVLTNKNNKTNVGLR